MNIIINPFLKKDDSLDLHPTLLSIAGSDPCGGAGIQADLKTVTSIGIYGAAAVTCITVQNSRGVTRISPLASELVTAQIRAVLTDHDVTHIKIGMTGNSEIIEALDVTLCHFSGEIIYDPVLTSTTGESLIMGDALKTLRAGLLTRVSILTPNISELQAISHQKITSVEDALLGAGKILKRYPQMKAVIVKGGHLDEGGFELTDYMVQPGKPHCKSNRKRHDNQHLHGTGCTFSSALAAYLCLNNTMESAFLKAGNYMDALIKTGRGISVTKNSFNGPMFHAGKG